MTLYTANPFVYIFSILAIVAVVSYFAYGAFDRLRLEVRTSAATVTEKQFNKSFKSRYTTIIDGRSVVQSQETPETYAVVLKVGDEPAWGLVSKQLYESLQTDDTVQVRIRRTRLTRRLEVVEVKR